MRVQTMEHRPIDPRSVFGEFAFREAICSLMGNSPLSQSQFKGKLQLLLYCIAPIKLFAFGPAPPGERIELLLLGQG